MAPCPQAAGGPTPNPVGGVTRADQLLYLPAEEPLVEPDEGRDVGGLDTRAGQAHRRAFHHRRMPRSPLRLHRYGIPQRSRGSMPAIGLSGSVSTRVAERRRDLQPLPDR